MFRKMSLSGWVLAIFVIGVAIKMYLENIQLEKSKVA